MEKTKLHEEWELRLEEFKSSGMTQSQWSKANNITVHKLKYWIKRIKKFNSGSHQGTKWLPVSIEENAIHTMNHEIRLTIGDITIEIVSGYNQDLLKDVIRTIRSC